MSTERPREWWIDNRFTLTQRGKSAYHLAFLKECAGIHVIEHSAYERVCKERDRLRAALERIAEMAVRPKCVCGLPTGTGAIEMSARKALEGE